jgi:hypothetical protein
MISCYTRVDLSQLTLPARRDMPIFWPFFMRNKMKVIALTIGIFALSQAAIAQTPECKSIAASGERLACYDKAATPAKTTQRPAASKAPNADPAKYVDTISAEDARMNAQLKNICRGC